MDIPCYCLMYYNNVLLCFYLTNLSHFIPTCSVIIFALHCSLSTYIARLQISIETFHSHRTLCKYNRYLSVYKHNEKMQLAKRHSATH